MSATLRAGVWATAFAGLALFASVSLAQAATLTTDKGDYFPGETAYITGTEFEPEQNVLLTIIGYNEDNSEAISDEWDVTADLEGFFETLYNLPNFYVPIYLLAATEDGEILAETTFTDSNPGSISAGAQNPASINAGNSATYLLTVTATGNTTPCPITITTTGLPTGASSGPLTITTPTDPTETLTINTTGAVTSGSHPFTIIGTRGSACQGSGTITTTATLVVAAPATTPQTITVTTPAPVSAIYGNTFPVAATASSGLGVAITTSGSCSGSGTGSATITMTSGSGTCVVHYNQAGNGSFDPAPEVTSNTSATKRGVAANITADDKVYDATTFANVSSCTLAGEVAGDDVSCTSPDGAFSNKNVGTGKTVLVLSGITLGGADAADYELVADSDADTADITPYTGIIATATAADKEYDGTNAATALLSFGNIFTGDDLTPLGYASATFDTADVGTGKTVTVLGITGTGADVGNYTWNTSDTDTADITPATADCSSIVGVTVDYDALPHGASGTCTGVDDEDLSADVNLGDSFTNVPGGTANWSFSNPNYDPQNGSVPIEIVALSLVGSFTADNKVYDSTTGASVLTRSVTGLGLDDVTLTGGTAAFDTKNVGNDKTVTLTGATLGGIDAGNYVLDSVDTTTANITPYTGIIATATAADKEYDGTNAATALLSFGNIFTGDDLTPLGYASATFDTADVGTGKTVTVLGITGTGADVGNYTWNTSDTDTADITPATADCSSIVGVTVDYDALPHGASGTCTGVDDEDLSADVNLGDSFTNVPGGTANWSFSNPNYDPQNGSVPIEIVALSLVGSFTADNKVYDSTTGASVLTRSVTGLGLDDVTLTGGTAAFDTKNVGNDKTVTLTGATLGGIDAGNYVLDSVDTTTANITPYTGIIATATADDKEYDGTNAATALLSFGNIFTGDDLTPLGYASATFDTADVGTGKTVTVLGITGTGADVGNYTWNTSDTDLADITPATATCTISGFSGPYDGAAHGATGSCTGVGGELDVLAGLNLGATYTDVPGGTASWSFDGGLNYFDQADTVEIEILALHLVGQFTADNKTYDGNTDAAVLSRSLSGTIIAPDVVTLVGGDADFDTADVGTGKTVTLVGATLGGADAGNYILDSVDTTTADIEKADADCSSIAGYSETYDGNPHTATGTCEGVGGDGTLAGLDLSGTTHTNAGSYPTDPWTFTDVTGNYNNTGGTVADNIDKVDAVIVVNDYNGVYDAAAHGVTGTATGVLAEDLSANLVLGATYTDVPGGLANWTFTDTTGNYNDDSGTANVNITKADADCTVAGYDVTYDGNPHTATGSCTGVEDEVLAGLDLSGTTHTDAGSYPVDPWTFTDVTGNYNDDSGTVADNIDQDSQIITFANPGSKIFGSLFASNATADSGLVVTLTSSNGNCTISGLNIDVTGPAGSSCTITASQAGGGNYLAADPVERTFLILPYGVPTTFPPITLTKKEFQKSSTIPVKFKIASTIDGSPVTWAIARLDISTNPATTWTPAVASGGSNTGNLFRSGDQYIFNLSTKMPIFVQGNSYTLRITLDDGSVITQIINIK